jgi:hypothetical protein
MAQDDSRGPHATPAGRPQRTAAHKRDGSAPVGRNTGSVWWLLPALTFLAGLALGAVLVGVTRPDQPERPTPSPGSATSTTTQSPTTGPRPDATVRVPGPCLDVAAQGERLVGLLDRAAGAIRDLDAAQLSGMVRQVGTLQAELRDTTAACRAGQQSR